MLLIKTQMEAGLVIVRGVIKRDFINLAVA